MAKITYRLNKGLKIKNPKTPTSIFFRFSKGREVDFNASLKIKVLEKDWDKKNEQVRSRAHILSRDEINNHLSKLKAYFEEQVIDYKRKNKALTYSEVKMLFNNYTIPKKEEEEITLFSFIDTFIEKSSYKKNLETGRTISNETTKSYKVTKNILKEYHEKVNEITLENIDMPFYYDFIHFCENKNLSVNYIGKHIKTLKTFLNEGYELGLTNNVVFKSRKFKVLKENVKNIYLTKEELDKIRNLDLSFDYKLDEARDLFLLGAYTGLRVSDYNNLKKENVTKVGGHQLISVKTQKTAKEVVIPLHPVVIDIFSKYGGHPPPKMPDQKINERIKIVGEMAGLDSYETTKITKGGVEVSEKKFKYECIKTHTARRYFCSNAYLSGMGALDIMAISGHNTEKAFLNYIKVTREEHALRMAKNSFFKGS